MSGREPAAERSLWPAFVIVALQWLVTFGPGWVAPATFLQGIGMMTGPGLGLLSLYIWWFFRSRAPRFDRVLGVLLPTVLLVLAGFVLHPSTPMFFYVYGLPILCLVFVASIFLTRGRPARTRRLAFAAAMVLATGGWGLLRSEGVDGDMGAQFAWRWQQTSEQRLLAAGTIGRELLPGPAGGGPDTAAEAWPGFRGPARDSVVRGLRVATDWSAAPPQKLWRRPVGPGWGSFAIAGELLYTQEQHGEDEVVTAYHRATGEPVWQHRDKARFWEAMAGTGPRATPSVRGGRLFAVGATGILNALDAATGRRIWSRNIGEDSGGPVPEWGFSSSPLLVDDLVVVVTGAPEDKGVVAYDLETGEPRWYGPAGPLTYSSAHLATLGGVRQLLVLSNDGATALKPEDGGVLWQHDWLLPGGARVVQPAITDAGEVLIGTGFGVGLRSISVENRGGQWQTAERWTSKGLKPYYNDIVLHRGHVYGFDGRIMACVRLEDGQRVWKGGRYGSGQALLLPEQDLLLVVSDRGDVALVQADPQAFKELARIDAIEGKTWNHPVLVDGVLYVRNGEEMAALRLPSV